jgi:hypothetical protein
LKYSFDTSVILSAWNQLYTPDVFPKWWQLLEGSIKNGDVRASEEVFFDLKKKDDNVYKWAKGHRQLFVPIDIDIQKEVTRILDRFEKLVDTRRSRSASDPFVIALAKLNNAYVVTAENSTLSLNRPNIPDVCSALGIPCKNMMEFMRELQWIFS